MAFSEREIGRLKTKLGPSAGAGTKLQERLELRADGSTDSAVVSRTSSADEDNRRGTGEDGGGDRGGKVGPRRQYPPTRA